MSPLSIRLLFAASLCLPAVCVQAAGATAPHAARRSDAATQFHRLLDDHWEWSMREFPGQATAIGDHRYDDRLTDLSAAGVARRKQMHAQFLARLKGIDAGALRGQDSVSYAVFAYNLRTDATIDAIYGKLPFSGDDSWLPLSTMGGIHTQVAAMPRLTRFDTAADYRAYLKRLNGLPRQIDHVIASLQAGIDSGWMPAAVAVARVPQQLDTHLETDLEKNLVYAPFRKFAADIPAAEQAALAEAGRQAVLQSVVPAFRKLKTFYETQYLPRARKELAASTLPGGMAFYQAMIGRMTTTGLSAQQIHDTGLAEVARITAFIRFLNTDPRFFKRSGEEVLAAYRDIVKRVEPQLPRLFAQLPRAPVGVRAIPEFLGIGAVESYNGPSLDGTRPGWFNANVLAYAVRPTWGMEAIALHEAVPGHHLQIARAVELGDMPTFRRSGGFTVYSEGWGLYAETLGPELGLYQDPYSRFGFHTNQAWRAARLVVDTGIHAQGLDAPPGHRVHDGSDRHGAQSRGMGSRPLHLAAGPGAHVHDRPAEAHRAARQGEARAGPALRHPPLPHGRPRPGATAAGPAGAGDRRLDRPRPRPLRFSPGPAGFIAMLFGQDVAYATGTSDERVRIDAPVVFVGYGIRAPEENWNDYKNIDVRGKFLIMLVNDPQPTALEPKRFGGKSLTWYGRWVYKFEQALREGAAGVLLVHTTPSASYDWSVASNTYLRERFHLDAPGNPLEGWIQEDAARTLFRLAGQDLDALRAKAETREFEPVELKMRAQTDFTSAVRRVDQYNVVGMVPGSDPVLKSEAVVYSAHWDHFGKLGERIWNGAIDNGSGTAALLAMAQAAAGKPAKRTQIFLWPAAEEQGLLGSAEYVRQPLWPLAKTAADLNLDSMNFVGRTRDIGLAGSEHSSLRATAEQVAKRMGLKSAPAVPDLGGSFFRADHFNFARAGVPAFNVGSAVFSGDGAFEFEEGGTQANARMTAFRKDYHQVTDRYDPKWDLRGMVQQAQFALELGYAVANAPKMPVWKAGAAFKR
jgi:uncharacterized protein (DUF885 family)/Zn-dependent M28 family amino/carboxypeptidase